MKKVRYKERFFVSKKRNRETCFKINDRVFSTYDIRDPSSPEWKKQAEILLSSDYDIKASGISIDYRGSHPYWHLRNLDMNKYKDWCGLEPTHVTLEMISDHELKFSPEEYTFEAPPIGIKTYIWDRGKVFEASLVKIKIEIYLDGASFLNLQFIDTLGGYHGINGPNWSIINENLEEYCRDSDKDFDNSFWEKKYKELIQRTNEDYENLQKEFDRYREWY